jgi:hypothetical protein
MPKIRTARLVLAAAMASAVAVPAGYAHAVGRALSSLLAGGK